MNKNSKIVALVMAGVMALAALTGCTVQSAPAAAPAASEAPAESATPGIDRIKAKGTFILGSESTYPPFEFIKVVDGQTVYTGMDVALCKIIAERLGVEYQQSEMAFDSLIPAVQAGNVDCAASSTPTEARKEVVDYTINYYETTNCFLVRIDEVDQFTDAASFEGKTVGAQLGTVQNTFVVEEMPDSKNLILPKTSTLVQELKTGNIDAICLEKPVADTYAAAYEGVLAVCPYEVETEEGGVGIPVAKGQEDLVEFINGIIQEMLDNGEMQRIYDEAVAEAIDQIVED